VRLGGEIYDHVGLPSLERFTDCRLIGDIGMNERVTSIAGDVAQVQMTARVGKLVDYHYAPVSLAERKTDEVRPYESCATGYNDSLHFAPILGNCSPELVAPAPSDSKNRSEDDPAILQDGPRVNVPTIQFDNFLEVGDFVIPIELPQTSDTGLHAKASLMMWLIARNL
jgi:hypothetical protein